MRWPWQRRTERRQSDGSFQEAVLAQIEAEAAGTAANYGATAALEATSGATSRAFAAARVDAPDWIAEAVTGDVLAQMGRDLVRRGETLHVIRMGGRQGTYLAPCANWHWEGRSPDPWTWYCRATAYGPSGSRTWYVPQDGVVFVRWGGDPGSPYLGKGPLQYASLTAKLGANAERSLGDEAGGPVAQVVALPIDPGAATDPDSDEEAADPLAALKASVTAARGRALFVETTRDSYGQTATAPPERDWQARRLGPQPTREFVELARDAFERTVAACGASVALFDDSDGTSKREALRQFHMGTVRPLAVLVQAELSRKLGAEVKLHFDGYPRDMVSRSQVFSKLTASGEITAQQALEIAGLLEDDAA